MHKPETKRERLFFALWPDSAVQQAWAAVARRRLKDTDGRFTRPETLHMTLLFLGVIPPQAALCLRQAVEQVCAGPFELNLDRLGYWKGPKIGWLGCSQVPSALTMLASDLRDAAQGCGINIERRPFVPHVTVMRKAHRYTGADELPACRWSVQDFALMRSDLTATPAAYQVVQRWSLSAC